MLLCTPAILLGQVVPAWLNIAGAFLFLAVALAAVVWSYVVFTRVRATSARGVPIAGLILGVMAVVLAAGMAAMPATFG